MFQALQQKSEWKYWLKINSIYYSQWTVIWKRATDAIEWLGAQKKIVNSKPIKAQDKKYQYGCIRTQGVLVPWSLHLWLCSPMVTHFSILQQPTDQWNSCAIAKSLGDNKKPFNVKTRWCQKGRKIKKIDLYRYINTHHKISTQQHITASLPLFLICNSSPRHKKVQG